MTAVLPDCLERIADEQLVAVIRAPDARSAVDAGRALGAGGVRALEIAFTTLGAASAIAELAADKDLLVGAGTVLDTRQAAAAIEAGAQFLVSPGLVPAVLELGDQAGVLTIPGGLTPTEVIAAAERAPVVKLFPSSLGGPSYLRALRAPLPELCIMPTGGVSAENVSDWFDAGAFALGAGADLCPPERLVAGDHAELTERARRYRSALAGLRRSSS